MSMGQTCRAGSRSPSVSHEFTESKVAHEERQLHVTFSLSMSISAGSVEPGGTTATETGPLATSAMARGARL